MAKKKIARKKVKKQKAVAAKKVAPKAKAAAKKKTAAKRKVAVKKSRASAKLVVQGKDQFETVHLKPKALVARAGAGGGDFEGVSIVESVDSESANELLEEGQAFEAGVVSGVEDAGDADEAEVTTHEVPQDDVPGEYDGKDRP